jgi:hypothetical protein
MKYDRAVVGGGVFISKDANIQVRQKQFRKEKKEMSTTDNTEKK